MNTKQNQQQKTWLDRLLRWTWKTIVIVVHVALWVTVGILQLVGAFILGVISANSPKNHRRRQRAKGDFRWG